MIKDKALKMALEALELAANSHGVFLLSNPSQCAWQARNVDGKVAEAITAINESLEQPEPVGWHTEDHLTDRSATTYNKDMAYRWECKGWPVTPLYTSPSHRDWVGLTDDDWKQIEDMPDTFDQGVAWALARLKEKNCD